MSKEKQYKFKGVVIKCTYNTPDYKIYAVDVSKKDYPDIKHNKYNNVSILGEISDLTLGVEYEITAEEQVNKYGTSYKVLNLRRDIPTTAEGTYLFLSEILTENQARVLIENYPNIIQKVKDNDLDDIDLSRLKGIGEKTFENIKDKIIINYCLMDLVIEFKNVLSMSIIKKIYDRYSSIDKLKEKLKTEPYTTLTRISGIGFKTADSIILQLQKENIIDFGYDVKTSSDRCLSCMLYLLEENENEGHTKMNLADLRQQCLKMVPACAEHFVNVIKDDSIYYNKETMDISLRQTYETEEYISNTILNNLKTRSENVWDYDITRYKNVGEFELSDEQLQILDVVCKNNIAILNGFAGSGKTASTQGLIKMLKDNNKSFRLFSPTGRAAKVLHENTNEPASTIHRGLGYIPPNGWGYNEEHKLLCDIVIVDEFSMVDIWLFKRLLDAIDFKYTKLLIIGDNAQLPSVSCGNLLHDFMQVNIIPTVTLNKIFRYSSGGLMRVATDTRCCKPYLANDMKSKATTFGDNQDYMFIDLASDLIPRNVVALYKKLLGNGSSIEDIQVLTAKNVGDCGSVVLNNMIQRVANQNYGSEVNMKVGETTYYEGDLILQTVNNYKAELDIRHLSDEEQMSFAFSDEPPTAFIANGETAIIKEIYNTYIIADFNGVYVKYYRNDMNMVKLGYCISIHKSQGGGFKTVILCTPQSHAFMLNSNLLYVGLTRMKEKLYHLGSLQTVNQAVKKKANLTRHTFMQDLLKNSELPIDK